VSTHHRDVLVRWVGVLELADEAARTYDVQGSDTEEALRVVDVLALEDLGADGHRAVDGVGDDEHVGVWAGIGGGFGEVADDGGIGVEEVYGEIQLADGWLRAGCSSLTITRHARLPGHTSGDEHNLSTTEAFLDAGGARLVAFDLYTTVISPLSSIHT